MRIRVKLMAALKEKSPEGDVLELPDGATVSYTHLTLPTSDLV